VRVKNRDHWRYPLEVEAAYRVGFFIQC